MTIDEKVNALKAVGCVEFDHRSIPENWKNPKTGEWEYERVWHIIRINGVARGAGLTLLEAINSAYKNVIEK